MPHDFVTSLSGQMITLLALYGPIVVYAGAFFLGENGIVAAFALSAQGFIAPQTVFLFAALGSLSADLLWYVVAVHGVKGFYEKKFPEQVPEEKRAFLMRMADRHTFIFIIIIKFLVGMRIFFTFYILLKKQVHFGKYLFFNAIGTILFVSVLFPVGWLLGKGVSLALSVEKGFFAFITLILAAVILINVLPRLFAFVIASLAKWSADRR